MNGLSRDVAALGMIGLSVCLLGTLAAEAEIGTSLDSPLETIDVAICLDTSGSMEPLIDVARLKLWEIVNDLAELEPTPQLRVALLTYGNNQNDPKQGWVRVETPLPTDLDLVSERLFELECAGGNEYVARVLKTALEQLEWNDSRDAIRLIFVAGNEPADQDRSVSFRTMGFEAHDNDAVLHAIYCGREGDPNAATWKELAELAVGQFATIDHKARSLIVETPFDREMAELGKSLNETFLPLGQDGIKGREIQAAQDLNVEKLGPAAAATRAQTKASALYAREWDLLEAVRSGRVDLYEIDESELPEVLREMTPSEREAYVDELLIQREGIRQRIRELGAQRRQYVTEQAKQKGLDDSRTFDGVVRRAIRQQVEERGYLAERP
jgi:hypothetical protein